MAMLQMLLMVATFVRRYDFALTRDEEVEAAPKMILHPRTVIEMHVARCRRVETNRGPAPADRPPPPHSVAPAAG